MQAFFVKIFTAIGQWLLAKAAKYLGGKVAEYIDKKKRASGQKKALDSYNQGLKDGLSEEEMVKRAEDLLNSGRK